ncbi:hypothetical protein Hamer_G021390 [Homarus americanus]|uniref:Uncharacterized protein n=1 Tax=Homarus americanus TaxID=6706 RepID=A0A8J5TKH6_HOMAM|nr:hypothetical protein Hamer_G021390 [Homarus americanus]
MKILKNTIGVMVAAMAATAVKSLFTLHGSSLHRTIIANGTTVNIEYMAEAFLYCWGQHSHITHLENYKVLWQTARNNKTVWTYEEGRQVYTIGCKEHIPHCQLVFHDFDITVAGEYQCVEILGGRVTNLTRVSVQVSNYSTGVPEEFCDILDNMTSGPPQQPCWVPSLPGCQHNTTSVCKHLYKPQRTTSVDE